MSKSKNQKKMVNASSVPVKKQQVKPGQQFKKANVNFKKSSKFENKKVQQTNSKVQENQTKTGNKTFQKSNELVSQKQKSNGVTTKVFSEKLVNPDKKEDKKVKKLEDDLSEEYEEDSDLDQDSDDLVNSEDDEDASDDKDSVDFDEEGNLIDMESFDEDDSDDDDNNDDDEDEDDDDSEDNDGDDDGVTLNDEKVIEKIPVPTKDKIEVGTLLVTKKPIKVNDPKIVAPLEKTKLDVSAVISVEEQNSATKILSEINKRNESLQKSSLYICGIAPSVANEKILEGLKNVLSYKIAKKMKGLKEVNIGFGHIRFLTEADALQSKSILDLKSFDGHQVKADIMKIKPVTDIKNVNLKHIILSGFITSDFLEPIKSHYANASVTKLNETKYEVAFATPEEAVKAFKQDLVVINGKKFVANFAYNFNTTYQSNVPIFVSENRPQKRARSDSENSTEIKKSKVQVKDTSDVVVTSPLKPVTPKSGNTNINIGKSPKNAKSNLNTSKSPNNSKNGNTKLIDGKSPNVPNFGKTSNNPKSGKSPNNVKSGKSPNSAKKLQFKKN